jgi:hypothetical protein
MPTTNKENGPVLHWATITSGAVVIFGAIAAGWAIFNAQLTATVAVFKVQIDAMQHSLEEANRQSLQRDRDMLRELERREAELKSAIVSINAELIVRRAEFVGQKQYEEFHKAVDSYMQLPYVTQKQFDSWKNERDLRLGEMAERVKRLEDILSKLPPR